MTNVDFNYISSKKKNNSSWLTYLERNNEKKNNIKKLFINKILSKNIIYFYIKNFNYNYC